MATEEPDTGLGGRLRDQRKTRYDRDKKWTLEYVAEQVGTTKANLWKIEGKPTTRIELDVFFALADLYEVDPRWLATGKRSDDAPPNLVAMNKDYAAIDERIRGPIRALITAVAEQTQQKPPPRKQKTKARKTVLEEEE